MLRDHAKVYSILESAKGFHILLHNEAPRHPSEAGRRGWLFLFTQEESKLRSERFFRVRLNILKVMGHLLGH